MGLEAIYPKKKLSKAHPEHKKYPYLLPDVVVDHPDQAWCTDIIYLYAIIILMTGAAHVLGFEKMGIMKQNIVYMTFFT